MGRASVGRRNGDHRFEQRDSLRFRSIFTGSVWNFDGRMVFKLEVCVLGSATIGSADGFLRSIDWIHSGDGIAMCRNPELLWNCIGTGEHLVHCPSVSDVLDVWSLGEGRN